VEEDVVVGYWILEKSRDNKNSLKLMLDKSILDSGNWDLGFGIDS